MYRWPVGAIGSASDSKSEGQEFEPPTGHSVFAEAVSILMLHYYQMALTILELITDLNSRVLQSKFETPRNSLNLSDVFIRNTPGFFDGIPDPIRGVFENSPDAK